MAVRFFGQYLLEVGAVTAEQLLAGIAHQQEKNRRFGELAMGLGLLDESQLSKALLLQRSRDLRVGEAAVELGFLKPDQVEQVLQQQRRSHVRIGEALLAIGALDAAQMDKHLVAHEAEKKAARTGDAVPSALDPSGLGTPFADLTAKMLFRVAGIRTQLVAWRTGEFLAVPKITYAARARFNGAREGEVALRADADLCARLVAEMVEEPISPDDHDSIVDGLGEFVNMLCGSLCEYASRHGQEIEASSPEEGEPSSPESGDHLLVAHLQSPDGEIDLALLTRG